MYEGSLCIYVCMHECMFRHRNIRRFIANEAKTYISESQQVQNLKVPHYFFRKLYKISPSIKLLNKIPNTLHRFFVGP